MSFGFGKQKLFQKTNLRTREDLRYEKSQKSNGIGNRAVYGS